MCLHHHYDALCHKTSSNYHGPSSFVVKPSCFAKLFPTRRSTWSISYSQLHTPNRDEKSPLNSALSFITVSSCFSSVGKVTSSFQIPRVFFFWRIQACLALSRFLVSTTCHPVLSGSKLSRTSETKTIVRLSLGHCATLHVKYSGYRAPSIKAMRAALWHNSSPPPLRSLIAVTDTKHAGVSLCSLHHFISIQRRLYRSLTNSVTSRQRSFHTYPKSSRSIPLPLNLHKTQLSFHSADMFARDAALPSLHPSVFLKLRFKLARANAIVYNACVRHRRRLEFIARIQGKRVLWGPRLLKGLSVGKNLVTLIERSGECATIFSFFVRFNGQLIGTYRNDGQPSQSCHTLCEDARLVSQEESTVGHPMTVRSVQSPFEACVPHMQDASKPGPSYTQGANSFMKQLRSYSPPPLHFASLKAQVEERRWECSQAWLDGTTEYQRKRREVGREREEQQELLYEVLQHPPHHVYAPVPIHCTSPDSRYLPRRALDPWELDFADPQDCMHRSSAHSPTLRSENVLSRHRPDLCHAQASLQSWDLKLPPLQHIGPQNVRSSSPSSRHVPPTSEHARPFRRSEAGCSTSVIHTHDTAYPSAHTSPFRTHRHNYRRSRNASRLSAQQRPDKPSTSTS